MIAPPDAHTRSVGWPLTRRTGPVAQTIVRVALWLPAVLVLRFDLASAILILAPLVIVPLGLELIDPDRPESLAYKTFRKINLLRLPAAWLLVGALFFRAQPWAAALAAPWLIFTLLAALWGMRRAVARGAGPAHDFCQDVGLVFLSIGGAWTFLFCLGRWTLGFEPIIVCLTGVHFHYAGFALPMVLSRVARDLPGRFARFTIAGTLLAIPMVAVGIAWSPEVEVVASAMLAAFCFLLAVGQLRLAVVANEPAARTLMAVSAMSLMVGMSLAVVYAIGEYSGAASIGIPRMIAVHGTANAIGFALLGLLGWTIRGTENV